MQENCIITIRPLYPTRKEHLLRKKTLLVISKVCGAGGIFPYSFKLLIYRTVYFCLFVYSSVFGDFCLLFIICQIIPFYHIKNIPFIIDASQCTYFITYLIF